jgi:hypothetical protein
MLDHLGFRQDAATYLTCTCGIDSLEEIAYLDGEDELDTMIKGVESLGGIVPTGTVTWVASSRFNGITVSIRVIANLNLRVHYLKHMERVQ